MLPKFKAVFPFKPIEMGLEYCYRKNDFIICPIIIGIHLLRGDILLFFIHESTDFFQLVLKVSFFKVDIIDIISTF